MNKKLETFFTENGFNVTKNKGYGFYKNYEMNVVNVVGGYNYPLQIHISFYATGEQKKAMDADLRNAKIKFFQYSFTKYGLSIALNDMTLGKLIARLPELLTQVVGILDKNGALNCRYCPVCGNELENGNIKKCDIDGLTITLDNDCVNNINSVISQENQDFKDAPNNYLRGFLGALIGGLVGAVIAGLLYVAGFVSSISAIVAVVLGAYLYQKFKGKPNKMMIVIVSLTSVVCMVISIFVVYIIAAKAAAVEVGVDYTAFEAFSICMQDAEFSRIFYSDLGLLLLFTAIGIVYQIVILSRQIKRNKEISHVTESNSTIDQTSSTEKTESQLEEKNNSESQEKNESESKTTEKTNEEK